MIVSAVPTVFVLGVTDAGLNEHVAIAGSPLHEKLTALAKLPCGVTVRLNVAVCPPVIVWLVGVAASVKLDGFTVSDKTGDVPAALLASPL